MTMIAQLYGCVVHINPHCLAISIAFSRKQTRKFKNNRWVKKYMKKYSYKVYVPTMYQIHDKFVIHPEIWKNLKEQVQNNEWYQNNPDKSLGRCKENVQRDEGRGKRPISTFAMATRQLNPQSVTGRVLS